MHQVIPVDMAMCGSGGADFRKRRMATSQFCEISPALRPGLCRNAGTWSPMPTTGSSDRSAVGRGFGAALPLRRGLSVRSLSVRGLSVRGLSVRGLSVRGLSVRGLSVRGLSVRGLSVRGVSLSSRRSGAASLRARPLGRLRLRPRGRSESSRALSSSDPSRFRRSILRRITCSTASSDLPSAGVAMVMARPALPARPVRPIRWT